MQASHVFEADRVLKNQRDFFPEKKFLPQDPVNVLDIGCGGASLAGFLAPETETMIGMDISLEVLKQVRQKLGSNVGADKVHLVVADASQLPFRDECMDYVMSRYTLHHTQLDTSLPEIHRILLPDGQVFLRDIFARWPALERSVVFQVLKVFIKVLLFTKGQGLKSGYRYMKFSLTRESLDHMLYENRLVDPETYESTHRRWFPGCSFESLRTRILFWEAPVLRWQKPRKPNEPGP